MTIDPLVGASLISGGASLVGGLLGIGGSKSSAKDSYKYQQKLMAQQQEYARENSATQYQRQRELTADSWLLNQQGMRNAGINPAFIDGSSNATASAPETAAPANGSVNVTTPDLSGVVQNGVQNLIAIQNAKADNRLKDSQSALNETKQMTAFSEALADLRIKKANASSAEVKSEIDNSLKDLRKQYEAMSIKNQALILDNERAMSDVKTFYTPQELFTHLQTMKAQLQQSYYAGLITKKDYETYDKRLSAQLLESSARTNLDRAKAITEGTIQDLNRSQSHKLDVDSLPHDMVGFISRSAVGRSSLYKLENGIKLSPDEEQFLRSLNTQNGIKDKNGLSLLISFLDKFTGK
jgi:hypothetical protein